MDEKIEITEDLKGVLVHTHNKEFKTEWLVLIDEIKGKNILRHISYCINTKEWHFDFGASSSIWSYRCQHIEFYKSTDEEKRFVAKKLASFGYKFIPILNKIVKK